jgi:hypothetical protein
MRKRERLLGENILLLLFFAKSKYENIKLITQETVLCMNCVCVCYVLF